MAKTKYYVYIIELDNEVLTLKKFTDKNPNYQEGKACFYVGQTAKLPKERFRQHQLGGRLSNKYVYKYGIQLCPRFYEKYNPISSRFLAEDKEGWLADQLQQQGFGVWWN